MLQTHILFVKVLEHDGLELLLVQRADVIDDGVQAELAVAGADILSAAHTRNLAQDALVQLADHDIALFVLHQLPTHRNRFAGRRTYTDAVDANPLFRQAFGRLDHVAFVVLTVCDEDDGAALLALRAEAAGTGSKRIGKRRTLHGNGAGADGIEEYLGRHVVGGNRQLDKGLTGKDHEADPVARQFVDQSGDGQFGTLQPVRRIVLRQHRIGDVQGNHHLHALAFTLLEARTQLRTGEADRKEEKGDGEEGNLEPALSDGGRRHQLRNQLRVAETGDPSAPDSQGDRIGHEEERHEQQEQQGGGMHEVNHNGSLLVKSLSPKARSRAISAATAYFIKSSV